jgi:hypothetical protein
LLVVLVRNKTDFIAVRLVRCSQPILAGQLADLGLGVIPKRKEHLAQLRLAEPVEDVGLVFGGINSLFQYKAISFQLTAISRLRADS